MHLRPLCGHSVVLKVASGSPVLLGRGERDVHIHHDTLHLNPPLLVFKEGYVLLSRVDLQTLL